MNTPSTTSCRRPYDRRGAILLSETRRQAYVIALAGVDARFLIAGLRRVNSGFGEIVLAARSRYKAAPISVTPQSPASVAPANHLSEARRRWLRSSRSSPNRIGGSTPRSGPTVAREPSRGKEAAKVVKTVDSPAFDARVESNGP